MYPFHHRLFDFAKRNVATVCTSAKATFVLSLIIVTMFFVSTARADPGGADLTFGNGGLVTSAGKEFSCLAKQPDGKIIVGGNTKFTTPTTDFLLIRYNIDGTLDHSFNQTGIVTTDVDGALEVCTAITVQNDGKILAAGYQLLSLPGSYVIKLIMIRYNPDGSLDNSFDGDGKLVTGDFVGLGGAYSIVIQTDGKIIAAGGSGMKRFNSDGSVDSLFGIGGKIGPVGQLGIPGTTLGIALQSDGKIITAGKSYSVYTDAKLQNFIVHRFNTDGTPDNSFGGDGEVETDFGGVDYGYSIVIQPDGKIVVGGLTGTGFSSVSSQFAVASYNPDGSLDTGFDGDGKVTTSFGLLTGFSPVGYSYSLSIQSDGKLLMTGGDVDVAIARYNTNGSLDNSFDSDGKIVMNIQGNDGVYAGLVVNNRYYVTGWNDTEGFVLAFSLDGAVAAGLSYRYYLGDWNSLPDFNTLVAVQSGFTPNVDITTRPAGAIDHFAYVWEGYINIQTPGNYTFETVSDDGSKFYFNTFYAPDATALVNNDGIHAAQSATGSVDIPAAGLYPIAINYFEKDGGEAMQLYWTGPGISRQLVPAALFTPGNIDATAPSAPTNLHIVYKGRTLVKLDWDNSTDNLAVTKYEVYSNGVVSTSTNSFITAENLQPNTAYTFTVKAVDAAGNRSAPSFPVSFTTVSTGLNYKFYTNVQSGITLISGLTPVQSGVTPNADPSIRPQGVNEQYAFVWEGYINIPSPGTYTFETISDDGSRFYFNTPVYSAIADPIVDNFMYDGIHAALSVSKNIYIPSAGLYPVVIVYYQYIYAQTMQLYWQGPNIPRQLIPDAAFTDDSKPGSLLNGLSYKYYEGSFTTLPDFSTLTPVKTGVTANVNLNERTAGHDDNFAFVWEGYITVPAAGDYTFETVSDDGSKLYFNSLYVPNAIATVNNDGLHAANAVKSVVHIGAAGTYPIAISFFENTGDQKMDVYWQGPTIPRQLIPSEALSPYPSQQINRLTYKYYLNTTIPWTVLPDFSPLPITRTGNTPNVDISVRPIDRNDKFRYDLFGFVWEGYINIPVAGTYTFETISDDGSKLYFNNFYAPGAAATVNNDGIHASNSASASVNITNAGVYPIAFTFFEQFGGETMEVYWSGPGMPRQRIPNEAFTLVNASAVPTPLSINNTIVQKSTLANVTALADESIAALSVYPNPFHESLAIDFYNSLSTNDITVSIFDLGGRKVYNNHLGRLPKGNNLLNMNLASLNLKEGVYVAQIQINGIAFRTVKIVKIKK